MISPQHQRLRHRFAQTAYLRQRSARP